MGLKPKWLALQAACLLLALASALAVQPLERNLVLAELFRLRGSRPSPDQVMIASINSGVAERLGLPTYTGNWPRSVYARLIERLDVAGVRLIVMDIAFREPRSKGDDQALAEAIRSSGQVVLFTYLRRHQLPTSGGFIDIEEAIPPLAEFLQPALASGTFVLPKYPARVFQADLWHELPSGLSPSQPLLAYLALETDRLQKLADSLGGGVPAHRNLSELASALYHLARNASTAGIGPAEQRLLDLFKNSSPRYINYYGPPTTINTLPLDSLLTMPQDELHRQVANKIVYVGFAETVQTDQRDAYRTVFSNELGVDLSGVEISATVFANLLENRFIQPFSPWLVLALTLAALLLTKAACRLPRAANAATQLTVIAGYGALVLWQFQQFDRWLPLLAPLAGLAVGNLLTLALRYQKTKRRERAISGALAQYLPKEAADRLGRDFTLLENDHRLVHGVCLVSDIRGYTRLSEQLPPDELHRLMNAYYAELVEVVRANGGIVGNIVGDSLLALWTGEAVTAEMCRKAFNAARQIQANIAAKPQFAARLPTCIGLHGGQFSLGNLGAAGHFEYSPVGDIINTASRVEHMNRDLGTDLLCSAPVAALIEEADADKTLRLRYLGAFELRNRSAAIGLYTLAEGAPPAEHFEKALQAYTGNRTTTARALFSAILKDYADGPSRYYLDRCHENATRKTDQNHDHAPDHSHSSSP